MKYKELTKEEQALSEAIEGIYFNSYSINKKSFVNALFFVGNKFKK